MSTQETESPVKKLGEIIKDIKFAMLTTADEDGTLRSRPMATQNHEFDGTLWFFTKTTAPKVDEVDHEHHVNVSYSDTKGQTYASVSGKAQLVHDAVESESPAADPERRDARHAAEDMPATDARQIRCLFKSPRSMPITHRHHPLSMPSVASHMPPLFLQTGEYR